MSLIGGSLIHNFTQLLVHNVRSFCCLPLNVSFHPVTATMSFAFSFADDDIDADEESHDELHTDADVSLVHHALLAPAKSLKLQSVVSP